MEGWVSGGGLLGWMLMAGAHLEGLWEQLWRSAWGQERTVGLGGEGRGGLWAVKGNDVGVGRVPARQRLGPAGRERLKRRVAAEGGSGMDTPGQPSHHPTIGSTLPGGAPVKVACTGRVR